MFIFKQASMSAFVVLKMGFTSDKFYLCRRG